LAAARKALKAFSKRLRIAVSSGPWSSAPRFPASASKCAIVVVAGTCAWTPTIGAIFQKPTIAIGFC
jgi:hypothetical protein